MALNCCDSKARIDALTREVAFFKDAAAAFCADLMCVESELDALKAELARVTSCLVVANANSEEFERKWYLACDQIDEIKEPA